MWHPVTLQGTHVRLEPLSLIHLEALSRAGSDPEIWRWTTSNAATADGMRRYLEEALEMQRHGTALPFATVERSSGQVIGSTRFGNIDASHRRAEIGWTWITPKWQRTAINTEAKYLMLRYAFEDCRCIRVEFKTDALNTQSRNALLRIGAREEGVLRKHMITESGRLRDSVYFSILEEEWPAVKATLGKKLLALHTRMA